MYDAQHATCVSQSSTMDVDAIDSAACFILKMKEVITSTYNQQARRVRVVRRRFA